MTGGTGGAINADTGEMIGIPETSTGEWGADGKAWGDISAASSLLANALDSVGADRVQVIFHPAQSGLRIAAPDLVSHADLIFGAAYGTIWILSALEEDWFVEVALLDQEVCVARDFMLSRDL